MIQIRTFTHRLAVSVLTLFTLASAACDKNEDSKPELELSLQGMAGQYAGTFNFIPTSFSSGNLNENSQPEIGLAVSFEVTPDGVLHFPKFPIEPLVEAILGEEASEEVLAQIGTISYDASLVRISSDGTLLSASLTTPVLRINIGTEAVITIESPKPLTFSKQGMLQFSLKAVKYWTDNTEASTRNDEWRFTAQNSKKAAEEKPRQTGRHAPAQINKEDRTPRCGPLCFQRQQLRPYRRALIALVASS